MHIENFAYSIEESETSFFNHLGSQKSQKRSASSYQVEYFLERGDFSDAEARSRASASLEAISDDFLEDIQTRLENKSRPSQAKIHSGVTTVALDSNLVAEFIEFVAHALSAESIRQKQSFITMDSLGKNLFGTNFTLKNNPAYPHSAYNTLFDSE
jgi:predicted Zn-dependent protease